MTPWPARAYIAPRPRPSTAKRMTSDTRQGSSLTSAINDLNQRMTVHLRSDAGSHHGRARRYLWHRPDELGVPLAHGEKVLLREARDRLTREGGRKRVEVEMPRPEHGVHVPCGVGGQGVDED